jgi:hypothetical protein
MKMCDKRLDVVMGEIFEVHDALDKVVNLLSLADEIHAALHSEPPHKSPLTLKAEGAREIVAEWMRRAEEQHKRDVG